MSCSEFFYLLRAHRYYESVRGGRMGQKGVLVAYKLQFDKNLLFPLRSERNESELNKVSDVKFVGFFLSEICK